MIWLLISLAAVLAIVGIGIALFVTISPQFGAKPSGAALERISKSTHFKDGKFFNLIPTKQGDILEALGKMPEMFKSEGKIPKDSIPTEFSPELATGIDSLTSITWFGHSAFFVELKGTRILIDPMLGEIASPLPFGSSRFPYQKEIPMDQLTDIDVVIISHDHYDHLDYPSIVKLKDEVKHFITPLGVGSHLQEWGIEADRITELDWWENTTQGNVEFSACPSRHFSGRGLTDANATQWASWVLKADTHNIYFSGDGGYGPHFKEIGERLGPFDFAMLECGQYNVSWSNIHMMPEESAQAGIDVKAKVAMPIHWGAFQLALHTWKDPVVRFSAKAQELNLPTTFPEVGERIVLGENLPTSHWWENME
jgi:L-ascorbate metabolism protein UlaG (beta-lactamase superfamily)